MAAEEIPLARTGSEEVGLVVYGLGRSCAYDCRIWQVPFCSCARGLEVTLRAMQLSRMEEGCPSCRQLTRAGIIPELHD